MLAGFSERRQLILKLVVQEFIHSAGAVSSESLVRKYQLPVSPATVRNDLAALEELGYLMHLYTSAGRVPTDLGYRFFVEHLMDCTPLSSAEQQTIRHQFDQVRGELDQWIQLAATVLARTAQNAAVVTPPRAYKSRFKHLELISIHEPIVLFVLVLHDGTVRQQMLALETGCSQENLRRISVYINEQCANSPVDRIEEILTQDLQPYSLVCNNLVKYTLELIIRTMHQLEDQINEQIHSDGFIEMLSQPEFIPSLLKEDDPHRAVERMRQMLEILTSSKVLNVLIMQALNSDDIQVVIGTEHEVDEMRDYSVVMSRYGVEGAVGGVLGVIGPTRMSYPRSISTVRYISSVMSDVISELYGAETKASE